MPILARSGYSGNRAVGIAESYVQLISHAATATGAGVDAGHRGQVVVVPADGERDVANHRAGPMRRIEAGPSGTWQQRLDPCVAGQFGRRRIGLAVRIGREIAGDIARGNSRKAQQADAEVREILADAAAGGEDVVNRRVHVGSAAVIAELIAHVDDHALGVRRDVLGPLRTDGPEKSSQAIAERHVAARAQKLGVRFHPGRIVRQVVAKRDPRRRLRRQHQAVDDRRRADDQLGVRRLDINRMREVAERVQVLRNLGGRGYVEPERYAPLIRCVDRRKAYIVARMRGGLLVNVSRNVFDAESHTTGVTQNYSCASALAATWLVPEVSAALSRGGLIML